MKFLQAHYLCNNFLLAVGKSVVLEGPSPFRSLVRLEDRKTSLIEDAFLLTTHVVKWMIVLLSSNVNR